MVKMSNMKRDTEYFFTIVGTILRWVSVGYGGIFFSFWFMLFLIILEPNVKIQVIGSIWYCGRFTLFDFQSFLFYKISEY